MMLRAICAGIFALAFASPGALGAQAGSLSDEDASAIRSIMQGEFTALMIAHDFGGLVGKMTKDVVFMPAGEPAIQGASPFQEWLDRNWGPLPIAEVEQKVDEVDGRGDLAFARGRYSITVEIEGIPKIHDQGKFLVVLEKQAGGSWLISNIMYSRDTEKPQVGD